MTYTDVCFILLIIVPVGLGTLASILAERRR